MIVILRSNVKAAETLNVFHAYFSVLAATDNAMATAKAMLESLKLTALCDYAIS